MVLASVRQAPAEHELPITLIVLPESVVPYGRFPVFDATHWPEDCVAMADVSKNLTSAARGERNKTRTQARARLALSLLLAATMVGCTSFTDYFRNGLKVGPNYQRPAAPVAVHWIDANDVRVRSTADDLSTWWTVFNDPALNWLVGTSYRQNLTLREAGFRVLAARAQLAISVGFIFPQSQDVTGSYMRNAVSTETANGSNIANPFFSQWNVGFNLGWEIDFWGRFRRAVEADSAELDASVENYDDVLVTLLSDVASNYATMRTLEERLRYTLANVQLQKDTLRIVNARFQAGTTGEADVHQAASVLAQTEAQIPVIEIDLRIATNQLCILLGIPPEELQQRLGAAPIPVAPPDVAVGVPADLLRRRPDVRRAERQAAAQSARIGVAESEFYPHISVLGSIGYSAQEFQQLFNQNALVGSVGPSFQWNVLQYGRLVNNVRLQDARFQQLVANYQNTVLTANRDAENGLVTFLRSQQRTKSQAYSVSEAEKAVRLVLLQYKAGTTDYTRVAQVERDLVLQQDLLAQAQGQIAQGLIQVYRALGGGWQIRLGDAPNVPQPVQPGAQPQPQPGVQPAPVPLPRPVPEAVPQGPALRGPAAPMQAPPPGAATMGGSKPLPAPPSAQPTTAHSVYPTVPPQPNLSSQESALQSTNTASGSWFPKLW